MKHTYKRFVLVTVAVVMAIAGMAYWADTDQKSNLRPGAGQSAHRNDNAVPQEALAQIQQNLTQREYHISYDSAKHVLQSPNRMQGLRAYYRSGELTIVNRKDSAGHNFELKLINKGIYADGKKLFSPQRSAATNLKDNHLQIAHDGFVEEYINEPGGVRQNFIIESAPDGTRELEVRLDAEGAQVKQVGKNELILAKQSLAKFYYRDLHCWDADGEPLEASLAYANGDILIEVDVKNAAFPVTIDPLVVNGTPANASTLLEKDQAQAAFGYSVSSAGDINGDGYSDVIIGAPNYDKGESNEGVAFVYMGSASGLATAPDRTLEANQPDAKFGNSVANAGDVNGDGFGDVIVGAPMYDKNENNEGAAFVYHGSGAGLNAVPTTTLESNQPEANLGQYVAAAGDVNNDGLSDVITGAPLYDKGQSNEGAAFVYHGTLAGISNVPITTLESNQIDAQFGCSVKGAGDVDGDGYSDVIVGASMYDKGESNEGAAFVYHGSINGIATAAKTTLENNQAAAFFGFSASTAGDVNGDGFSDVIVGSFHFDNGQNNEGGAFVYHGSANGISTTIAKQLECNQAGAQYGASVASAGDVNGDGYADVIVGANLFDNGQGNEGGAFVYEGSSSGLANTSASSQEGNQLNAYLGSSVSSAGDVNGDGYSDIVVSGQGYDKGEADEGVAMVWLGGAKGTNNYVQELNGSQNAAQFGYSVANAGDVNGDGYSDIIAGEYAYNSGQSNSGAAYIYYGSSQGIVLNTVTKIDNVSGSGLLGYSVAGAGDVNGDGFDDVIIGDVSYFISWDAQKGLVEGAALVYYGSAQGLNKNTFSVLKNNQTQSSFGWTVSSAGDVNGDGYDDVLVGDPNHDKVLDEGAIFIYHGSGQGISTVAAITLEGTTQAEELGLTAGRAGDVNGDGFDDIIAGTPLYTNGQTSEGAARIFYGSMTGINNSATIIENNVSQASMGHSVSGAGDLNGDGFSDIVVFCAVTQANEGTTLVYYGSSSGINSNSPKSTLTVGQPAYYGNSVSSAGDFNGDGYGDLIVGAVNYSPISSGAAFMFFGSATGLYSQTPVKFESNVANSQMGTSVACAGDVNGDGYSDILIGAPFYNSKGSVFLYKGNNGAGTRNNLRLYNSNLTTPINHTQFAQNNFGAGLYAKSFLGRNKAKLVWETKPANQGFSKGSNNSITNSTQSTSAQNAYSNLGLAGIELKNVINKQGAGTKVRIRVKYDPVLALTGQTYSPWRYLPAYLIGSSTAPVPEQPDNDILETTKKKATMELNDESSEQIVIYPNPASDQLNVKVKNPELVRTMKILDFNGTAVYQATGFKSTIDISRFLDGIYIVLVINQDGTHTMSKVLVRE
ncbi:FG-GAP-like repeat-containing protein [Dyadobacter fermentans]|uniref:FG-GAP repeat protein n=1 Tax=Dyadobacter fermentans (strain ATCC 700827 / DSM 18053 / CIP 107007 / KCTC 52180 / NS114) TaxID=471854 RepID=C6W783_DYAFD|nr:FG-GAP-like repeat-containing protein [Dyadobacter fermentans]ACT94361.1 FG-GAP repeat protein [Dyadobacter fermentans DSM 18053]